jgi:hypothetical protein
MVCGIPGNELPGYDHSIPPGQSPTARTIILRGQRPIKFACVKACCSVLKDAGTYVRHLFLRISSDVIEGQFLRFLLVFGGIHGESIDRAGHIDSKYRTLLNDVMLLFVCV